MNNKQIAIKYAMESELCDNLDYVCRRLEVVSDNPGFSVKRVWDRVLEMKNKAMECKRIIRNSMDNETFINCGRIRDECWADYKLSETYPVLMVEKVLWAEVYVLLERLLAKYDKIVSAYTEEYEARRRYLLSGTLAVSEVVDMLNTLGRYRDSQQEIALLMYEAYGFGCAHSPQESFLEFVRLMREHE